ncbi:MAG TPA: hypothetical protein DEA22_05260 [Blastocatellia bacterium]|nr:hypothetical protein [Blastocatellia bacterium]
MKDLIRANLLVHPFRTLVSVIGVSVGVALVVLFTGLANGMTNEIAKRAANWKAEIVFTRPGSMTYDTSNASLPTAYVDKLLEIEGVDSAIPVIRNIMASTTGRWGFEQIDGVDWEPFAKMNDMKIVEGRAAVGNGEAMLDERQMEKLHASVGDKVELFGGKPYTVVGVFSPPSGSRIKIPLSAMQEELERPGKSTYILVKLKDGYDAEETAARIDTVLPGNTVNLTRNLIINAQDRIPGLKTFLRVMVGVGAFVSTIFVLLSMYATVTERRKEIGILKSLGASKLFVIKSVEGEAFIIGLLGVAAGLALSLIAAFGIENLFRLSFEFNPGWLFVAAVIAICGSLAGALYPAWRASIIDPVEVMANE